MVSEIIQIIVKDQPGVLDRIAGLVRRNGWNIKTITAANIKEGFTQISLTLVGYDINLKTLGERLMELNGICGFYQYVPERTFIREIAICRLPNANHPITKVENIRILDADGQMIYAEFTGSPNEVDRFIASAQEQNISCVRSGVLCFDKGEELK